MVNIVKFKTWFHSPTDSSSIVGESADNFTSPSDSPQDYFTSKVSGENEGKIETKFPLTSFFSSETCPNTLEGSLTSKDESEDLFTIQNPTSNLHATRCTEMEQIADKYPSVFKVSMVSGGTSSPPRDSDVSSLNSQKLLLFPAVPSPLVCESGEKETSTFPQPIDSFRNTENKEQKTLPIITSHPDDVPSHNVRPSENQEESLIVDIVDDHIRTEKTSSDNDKDKNDSVNNDSGFHFLASCTENKKIRRHESSHSRVQVHHKRSSYALSKPVRKFFKKSWWNREGGNTEKSGNSEISYYENGSSLSGSSRLENGNRNCCFTKREYMILALKEAIGKKGYLSSIDIDKQVEFINRNHKIRRWKNKNRDPQTPTSHHQIVRICESWELDQPIEIESNDPSRRHSFPLKEGEPEKMFHKDSSLVDPSNKTKSSCVKKTGDPSAADLSSYATLREKRISLRNSSAPQPSKFSSIQPVALEELQQLRRELLRRGEVNPKSEINSTKSSFQKNSIPRNISGIHKRKVHLPASRKQGGYPSYVGQKAELSHNPQISLGLKKNYSHSFSFGPSHGIYECYQNDYDNSSIISSFNNDTADRPYYHDKHVFDSYTAPNLGAPFPYIPLELHSSKLSLGDANTFTFDIDVRQIVDKLVSSRKPSITRRPYSHDGVRKLSGISNSGLAPDLNIDEDIWNVFESEYSEESISSDSDMEDDEIILPKKRSVSKKNLKSVSNVEEPIVERLSSHYNLSEDRLFTVDSDGEQTEPSFETVVHHPLRSISVDAISFLQDDDVSALKLSSDDEGKDGQESSLSNIDSGFLPQKRDLGSLFDIATKNHGNLTVSNTDHHHVIISTLLAASVPDEISAQNEMNNMNDVTPVRAETIDVNHREISKLIRELNGLQVSAISDKKMESTSPSRINPFLNIHISETLHVPGRSFDCEISGLGGYRNDKSRLKPTLYDTSESERRLTTPDESHGDDDNAVGSSQVEGAPSFVQLFEEKPDESGTPDKNTQIPLPPKEEEQIVLTEEKRTIEKQPGLSEHPLSSPCLVHWPVKEENWIAKILGEYCPVRLRNNERFDYDSYSFKVKQYYMTTRALLQDRYKTYKKVVFAPRCDKWLNFEMEMDHLDEIDDFIKINKNLYPVFKGPRIVRRKHIIRRWMNRKRDRQIVMEQLMEYWRRDPHIIDHLKWERQIRKPFPGDGASISPQRPSLRLIASRIYQRMTMDLAHKRLGRPPRNGSSVIMLRKGPPLGIDYFGYKRDKIKEWAHNFLLSI